MEDKEKIRIQQFIKAKASYNTFYTLYEMEEENLLYWKELLENHKNLNSEDLKYINKQINQHDTKAIDHFKILGQIHENSKNMNLELFSLDQFDIYNQTAISYLTINMLEKKLKELKSITNNTFRDDEFGKQKANLLNSNITDISYKIEELSEEFDMNCAMTGLNNHKKKTL